MINKARSILTLIPLISLLACYAGEPGPDKTIGGAILGAAWGAGAGAVVGNQLDNAGPGAGVGAGLGLVSGAAAGMGLDIVESDHEDQEAQLEFIKAKNALNAAEIRNIHDTLDGQSEIRTDLAPISSVYFDSDATSLKIGSISQLETLADAIKNDSHIRKVIVTGHSDDAGTQEYNNKLAEARAETVKAYLAGRGLSLGVIETKSAGSSKPVGSNTAPEGRQLNRRAEITIVR